MRRVALFGLATVVVLLATDVYAVEPGCREIRASITGGILVPSGDGKLLMKSGVTVGGGIGVALSPRFTAGFLFDFGSFRAQDEFTTAGSENRATGDNGWMRYAGGIFGEYLLGGSRLAPVVGGHVGVDGIHISYSRVIDGITGTGDYGVGFGALVGLRYRGSQRFGAMLDVTAENSSVESTGWYYGARAGVALFM